jgi:hypothetical protein
MTLERSAPAKVGAGREPAPAPPESRQGPGRPAAENAQRQRPAQPAVPEIGGPKGPEPTRYGDWEKGGRCTDF